MRKTPGHNPRGFERNSWNYRCLQLRHALGWSQPKFSKVSGLGMDVIKDLELGKVTRPTVQTIQKIKVMESEYDSILSIYKKAPVRMDRLRKQTKGRVRLLPIEIKRPEDIESLGKVEGNSEPLYFGRKTRRVMPQTGMSMQRKAHLLRRNQKISRTVRAKVAAGWRAVKSNREKQSGQPDDTGTGQG